MEEYVVAEQVPLDGKQEGVSAAFQAFEQVGSAEAPSASDPLWIGSESVSPPRRWAG